MPIIWNLRKWLAVSRDIYRPVDLQLLLREKAGVILSHQSVAALMHGTPSALRLQTIQALCTALDCNLRDFCEVLPNTSASQMRRRKSSGGAPEPPRRLYGADRSASVIADADQSPFPTPYAYYLQPGHPTPIDAPTGGQLSTSGKRAPTRRRPTPESM